MAIDFKALGAKAAAEGKDMTKAQSGGGDYTPAAAGPGLCRFIGYVEIGKQKTKFKGQEKLTEQVQLIFELVGKRHPPQETQDGTKLPYRITVTLNLSLNEKAGLFKLFQRMNYKQDAQHMAQLLGNGFKCEVFHDKWTDRQGKERIDATFKAEDGSYAIFPPRKEDEDSETGWVDVAVPEALSPIRCFLWHQADLEQWDSLFIEGEYPERKNDKGEVTAKARSKNVLQNKVKSAVNFSGSTIHTLLLEKGGVDLTVPEDDEDTTGNDEAPQGAAPSPTSASSTTPPSDDALGGIV